MTAMSPPNKNICTVKYTVSESAFGLILCISGMICLIFWGLISMIAPSMSDNLAESSMIQLDGNGILILICIFAIVFGAFLILKGTKERK